MLRSLERAHRRLTPNGLSELGFYKDVGLVQVLFKTFVPLLSLISYTAFRFQLASSRTIQCLLRAYEESPVEVLLP